MGDPLFAHGVGLAVVVIVLVKVLVAFAALLVSVMLMIWFERKVISDMQNRIGPNRAGPFGLLQTLADGTKLFFKEDLLPSRADRTVFRLAPFLSLLPAFLIFTVVPIGGVVTIAHHVVQLQVADPPIGILLVLALGSVAVYGTMLAGWSSGSKYPLLGSVRASAQMISYEAVLGLTVVMVVLKAHSLSTRTIVASQAAHFWQWNVLRLGVIPFVLFFIALSVLSASFRCASLGMTNLTLSWVSAIYASNSVEPPPNNKLIRSIVNMTFSPRSDSLKRFDHGIHRSGPGLRYCRPLFRRCNGKECPVFFRYSLLV